MAFKLAIGNVIEFPVRLLVQDGALQKEFKFFLSGQRLDAKEAADLLTPGTDAGEQRIDDFLKARLQGWRDQKLILDAETNDPIPFGAEALGVMLGQVAGAAMVIYQAYMTALVAKSGAEGARKN
jgi:hypothetical protein